MIEDWDDAYQNGAYIEGAQDYPARWAAAAAEFRETMARRQRADCDIPYRDGERGRFDLFRAEGEARGLLVFVHGGYWRAFDKSAWSQLAAGPVARGWSVAMPSYDLAPAATISAITRQIGQAIEHAAGLVEGPIRLTGHSAGGHLVTRMICRDSPLAAEVLGRIDRVVSISGLHDLRPLMKTSINDDLRLLPAEAAAESPALNEPVDGVELLCWVGAEERPEFRRQADLLANIWTGFGIPVRACHADGQHHFNVIDGLTEADSPLCHALLNGA